MTLATLPQRTGMNDLLTVLEVMAHLKVCRATVQRWCKEGKLPAVKIGKEYRVRRRDLDSWYDAKLPSAQAS
ncbi:MAG: helix-turn-helix domain-containing protein [Chloroflexi bacterium]|nr:helix-turn-helix domain-containing protein [Chloroflexota bacterium]